nr:MauE/DoxX family redox-associated membrane protein [Chitinophaga hostae]
MRLNSKQPLPGIRTKGYIAQAASGLLICLFLYTGLDKMYNHSRFMDALEKSYLLADVAGVVTWSLPVIEILIAVALFVPSLRMRGFKYAIVLLSVFTFYLCYMMVVSPKLPCMCAGVLEGLSWKSHIAFNIVMIVLAILGMMATGKCLDDGSRAPPMTKG